MRGWGMGTVCQSAKAGRYGVVDRRELGRWIVYRPFLCDPEFVENCNLMPHMGGARN